MTMYLGMLAAGLVVGVLVGFTAGKAYAPGYREWVTENESTFAKGYSGGWGDAAMLFARKFRDRALEAKNTWTITKDELDRLEKEMTEDDSD